MIHPAFRGLPPVFFQVLPELLLLEWPREVRATCHRCALVPAAGGDEGASWQFLPDVRCCSFHPALPNFLVGRALAAGGPSAACMRRRLVDPDGLTPLGVLASRSWWTAYHADEAGPFGRNRAARCPYWRGGRRACAIWPPREAVCRTWYCRYVWGAAGSRLWGLLRQLLGVTQRHLAIACAAPRPSSLPNTAGGWEDWYLDCAARLDGLRPAELGSEVHGDLRAGRLELRRAWESRTPAVPSLLVPAVRELTDVGDGTRLVGYSSYDGVVVPRRFFQFLSRLDGTLPWRELLHALRPALGAWLSEELVERLFRIGALAEPNAPVTPAGDRQQSRSGGGSFRGSS